MQFSIKIIHIIQNRLLWTLYLLLFHMFWHYNYYYEMWIMLSFPKFKIIGMTGNDLKNKTDKASVIWFDLAE